MADAALQSVLENLEYLLAHEAHLIKHVKNKLESLQNCLRMFKAFLKDSVDMRRKDDRVQAFVRQIGDVVFEVEDIVDAFVAKYRGRFFSLLHRPVKLFAVTKKVKKLAAAVTDFYGYRGKFDFQDDDGADKTSRERKIAEMADAAQQSVLENLEYLLAHKPHMIKDSKKEVESLQYCLRMFKDFLKDSVDKRRKDDRVRAFVRQIVELVFEVEDIVDAFVAKNKYRNGFFMRFFQRPVKLLTVTKEVEKLAAAITEFYGYRGKFDFQDDDGADLPINFRVANMVGFEDEAEKLLGYLAEETQSLGVVSITGMPGLGKTALAGRIFHDQAIQYKFPIRIWVYISQEFNKKDVFLAILRQLTRPTENMHQNTEEELAQQITRHLEDERFLIVMDDVWTREAWDKLRMPLPERNKKGRVLITSRNEGVARYANRSRDPLKLQFLTSEESWLLLQLKVFGEPECPRELEVVGKLIAQQCHGLPLALVVVGGLLVTISSASHERSANRIAWEKVSESGSAYLVEDPLRQVEKIISSSYDNLPHDLRPCFLYLGMFPEDFEIPVWKLFSMWIAEGFILPTEGFSLEETAESYLKDLIDRNLVGIDKIKSDGSVKTCRVHAVLRNFCIIEAVNERKNFVREIKSMKSSGEIFEHPVSDLQKCRRLCVHSDFLSFISTKPVGPDVRSLVCFSEEETDLPAEYSVAIPDGFKLVKVLDLKPIRFNKVPTVLFQLIQLRYMAMSFHLSIVPSAFSKLWNLRTLIVDTTSQTLEVKADIWGMLQLRHFKTNVSTTFPKPARSRKDFQTLQTLGAISAESCTDEFFNNARNVRELAIRGRLTLLLEVENGCSFDSLTKLDHLEKLKLLNDVFPSSPLEGRLHCLPPPYKFPRRLRSVTLAATFLAWKHMSTLARLERLEVLKLKDNAFVGRLWEATDGGFRRLDVLQIEFADLVVWEGSGHHFPRLRRLELHNCESLCGLPDGLADIPTLQVLELYRTTASAAASAKKISEAKRKQPREAGEFKLSIFPTDE